MSHGADSRLCTCGHTLLWHDDAPAVHHPDGTVTIDPYGPCFDKRCPCEQFTQVWA